MVPRHGIAVHSAEYVGSDAAGKKKKRFSGCCPWFLKKRFSVLQRSHEFRVAVLKGFCVCMCCTRNSDISLFSSKRPLSWVQVFSDSRELYLFPEINRMIYSETKIELNYGVSPGRSCLSSGNCGLASQTQILWTVNYSGTQTFSRTVGTILILTTVPGVNHAQTPTHFCTRTHIQARGGGNQ